MGPECSLDGMDLRGLLKNMTCRPHAHTYIHTHLTLQYDERERERERERELVATENQTFFSSLFIHINGTNLQ